MRFPNGSHDRFPSNVETRVDQHGATSVLKESVQQIM